MKATAEAVVSASLAKDLARRGPVLGALAEVVEQRAPGPIERKLAEIRAFLDDDLSGIEADLAGVENAPTPLHASVHHLLGLGAKRIRPMCVALAARIGGGFTRQARDLAVAAELVHNATLLHDDVVDVGDKRRGAPTARLIYGNAASIFAGDWLLVEALMRVRRANMIDVLDRALGVLAEMLEAEALQLKRRGRADVSLDEYMRVVRGKTASLFRWSLFAGARAGGVDPDACARLESFGEKMGVAFQVIDDVIDVEGDPSGIGKEVLQDLREGKMTYPLMVALERDPELKQLLCAHLETGAQTLDADTAGRAHRVIIESGGAAEARSFAERLVEEALVDIRSLPDKPAKGALIAVAHAVVNRRS